MIISGSLGMGLWYRDRMLGRLEALRELLKMQEMLVSEIRYGKATLPECCLHLADHLSEPYQGTLRQIYDEMAKNTGAGFGQVFQSYMEKCLEGLPLTADDRNIFLTLFSEKGFEDNGMQIRTIEQSGEQLQNTIDRLEKEKVEKCRMAVGLGAMSGLLLLVVLL